MSIILVLFALVGGIATVAARSMSTRRQWLIGTGFGVAFWISVVAARVGLEPASSETEWLARQTDTSYLAFKLDTVGWSLTLAAATFLLAWLLLRQGRMDFDGAGVELQLFLYIAAATAGFLAGSAITILLAWLVMDLLQFLWRTLQAKPKNGTVNYIFDLSVSLASTILLMVGLLIINGAAFLASNNSPTPNLGIFIILLATIPRFGLFQHSGEYADDEPGPASLDLVSSTFGPAMGLAFLIKTFSVQPNLLPTPVLFMVGVAVMFVASTRWLVSLDIDRPGRFAPTAIWGLGIAVFGVTGHEINSVLLATGTAIILLGGFYGLFEPKSRWHVFVSIGPILLLLGLPYTLTSWYAASIAAFVKLAILNMAWAALIVAGWMILLAAAAQLYRRSVTPWRSGEDLVRYQYGIGLLLPLLTAGGLGVLIAEPGSFSTLLISGLLITATILSFSQLGEVNEVQRLRWRRLAIWLDFRLLIRAFWNRIFEVIRPFAALAKIFEGRGAILWMIAFVFLLLVGLRS